jgi:hypothetical protein
MRLVFIGLVASLLICGTALSLTGELRVTDSLGKVWSLDTSWAEGDRPYPKDLRERERWYFEKNGDHWCGSGQTYDRDYDPEYMSPGVWGWEEYAIIPNGKKHWASPSTICYASQVLVYAAGGDSEITAVYAHGAYGFWCIEPVTKEISFIGNLTTGGNLDGFDSSARLEPSKAAKGTWSTVDPITGRLYFTQKLTYNSYSIRYVEKLLPYAEEGHGVVYLPAYLDYKDMYIRFRGSNGGLLTPFMENGQRGKSRYYVGTTAIPSSATILATSTYGPKITISPDGKTMYLVHPGSADVFANASLFDIASGTKIGNFSNASNIVAQTSATERYKLFNFYHNPVCAVADPYFYGAAHSGCCGTGTGMLYRVNPVTGVFQMLYDGSAIWDSANMSERSDFLDNTMHATLGGPADATTLQFTTTSFQNQCPRTGAIVNGGWDGAGIRHYKDGFVTSFAQSSGMARWDVGDDGTVNCGRPEWGGKWPAVKWPVNFGSLQNCPDIAPNGDIFLSSNNQDSSIYPVKLSENSTMDSLRKYGIRVLRFYRKDWPVKQPVNGYANQFCSPLKRDSLMVRYGVDEYDLSLVDGTLIEADEIAANKLFMDAAPNPFNPDVTISVSGWKTGAELKVLDVNGKVVADLTSSLGGGVGHRQISWNASNRASGVYLFVLRYGKVELKRKAMLIR